MKWAKMGDADDAGDVSDDVVEKGTLVRGKTRKVRHRKRIL